MASIIFLSTQPYDFWRDPLWQFIGVIAAVIFGITGLVFGTMSYRQQQRRKQITYSLISDAPIVSIDQTLEDKVQVLLNGEPAEHIRLLVLEILNSGNISIKPEDYSDPISFEFKETTILNSEMLDTEPEDLMDSKNQINIFQIRPIINRTSQIPSQPQRQPSFFSASRK